jgi:hypothetical protein
MSESPGINLFFNLPHVEISALFLKVHLLLRILPDHILQ